MSDLITPTATLILPAGAAEADWHRVRQTGVGGSDVAAILGMHPYRGPRHVYLAKRGEGSDEGPRLKRAARRGHRLEGLVAEFFAEETGRLVVDSPGTLQHAERPYMLANPDRITFCAESEELGDPAILECKSRTWRSARAEDWRGTEPPDGPALQAHWYLAVTGYDTAYVAGLLDDDFVWFRIDRDQELIDHLADYCGTWWQRHILNGEPPEPDGSKATTELLAHLWDAEPQKTAEVDARSAAELLARRSELKQRMAEVGEELNAVENQMRAAISDAEIATVGGLTAYTWIANGTLATKRLKADHPDLVAKYHKQVTATDWNALAADHPDIYRRYRARVLRVPKKGGLT